MSDEVKATELKTEEEMDAVAGGKSNIDFIICPRCGLEVKLNGWQHNFKNECPRCGATLHSW